MQVDSNSCGAVAEDGAKTAPMDRQVHRGCCYTMIVDVNIFVMPRKHHM